jgi:Variant SH3 domain
MTVGVGRESSTKVQSPDGATDRCRTLGIQSKRGFCVKYKDNELTLLPGDRITIVEFCNNDWYEGTLDGKTAYFPANYVRVLAGTL